MGTRVCKNTVLEHSLCAVTLSLPTAPMRSCSGDARSATTSRYRSSYFQRSGPALSNPSGTWYGGPMRGHDQPSEPVRWIPWGTLGRSPVKFVRAARQVRTRRSALADLGQAAERVYYDQAIIFLRTDGAPRPMRSPSSRAGPAPLSSPELRGSAWCRTRSRPRRPIAVDPVRTGAASR